jgi:hypothetical protein
MGGILVASFLQRRNIETSEKKRHGICIITRRSWSSSSLVMIRIWVWDFTERKTKKAWDLRTERYLAGMTPDDPSCFGDFY